MLPELAKELANQMLSAHAFPPGINITAIVQQGPGRLLLTARSDVHLPHRAGSLVVSQPALDDQGHNAVGDALQRLIALIETDRLPSWGVDQPAPILGTLTSNGWEDGRA